MALKPATLTLKEQIQQELVSVDARATELRIALKVVAEFGTEVEVAEDTNGDETRRIILKPTDVVPEAVKSRLSEGTEVGRKLADRTLDLERT